MTWTRPNYRGRPVSLAGGVLGVCALVTGAGALAIAGADRRTATAALVVAVAAGGVGCYDDLRGDARAKGLAGHLRSLLRGRVTSGAVKLAVLAAAALVAMLLRHGAGGRALVGAAVVAGCANLLNLFDLRPGRALKVALLGFVPLSVVTPVALLGAGVAAALLGPDLRERTMLGDTGANALGAVLGVCAAELQLATAVLAAVLALTLASEVVSFSRVIDAVPPLRWADRLGRAA